MFLPFSSADDDSSGIGPAPLCFSPSAFAFFASLPFTKLFLCSQVELVGVDPANSHFYKLNVLNSCSCTWKTSLDIPAARPGETVPGNSSWSKPPWSRRAVYAESGGVFAVQWPEDSEESSQPHLVACRSVRREVTQVCFPPASPTFFLLAGQFISKAPHAVLCFSLLFFFFRSICWARDLFGQL